MKRDFMPVICIKSGKYYNHGEEGKKYFIDRTSIYIDNDGDAYGILYNETKDPLANICLKRFMSI